MPVKFTLSFDVTDEEFAGFLNRWTPGISDRPVTISSHPSDGPTRLAQEDDDNAPVNASAPNVDKNGIPWMEQYHSGSKAINADGTWKSRKGVDKAARAAAEAAYKAQSGAPAPFVNPMEQLRDTVTTAPTPFVAPVAAPVAPVADPVAAFTLPTFAAPVAPVADVPVSYLDVVAKFQALQAKGVVLDATTIAPVYAAAGITDPTVLTENETLRKALLAELNKIG